MEMIPPKIIENAVVATHKTSPSNGKNAMMGALAGMVLICGLVVVKELMDDTIQTEEDVEHYLGPDRACFRALTGRGRKAK